MASLPGDMSDGVDRTGVLTGGQPEPDPSLPPRVLSERYLLEERIAIGGMATVWRAHDEKLARTVGVKLLHKHLSNDRDFRERFRREAVAAAKLAHPGIVGVYDTGRDGDWVYLVMEFVHGVTLREVMVQYGRLDPALAASVGMRVAYALDFAHERGLVHRDVKPANILLGEEGAVKLGDFGIVKVEHSRSELTKTGMVLGTAAYVAPEQVEDAPIDGRADQYSLGCVLYEALSGQQPFSASSTVAIAAQRLDHEPLPLRSLRADVPRELDEVVMKALGRDPAARHANCRAFGEALEPWARDDDVLTQTTQVLVRGEALPAPEDEQPYVSQPINSRSFLRSEGRWLASVLALVALSALLTAVGVATGVFEIRGPNLTVEGEPEQPAEAAVRPQVLEIAELGTLDPEGTPPNENDEYLINLIDDNLESRWRTDRYNGDPNFGGLKQGLGIVVDMGEPVQVSTVTLTTPSPGITYELRVADEPSDDPAAWRTVARVEEASEQDTVGLAERNVRTRYMLIWIVGPLVQYDGGWTAAFSDLTIEGVPS
jgi:tRNA A-37 threonylcarbamoyl transferase component Bud32